jgi:hypothetical protein
MFPSAVVLSLALAAPAQAEPPAVPPPAPSVAPAQSPAVKRAYDAVLPSLVLVRIGVLDDPDAAYRDRAPIQDVYDNFARLRMSISVAGVRIAPEGALIIRDPGLPFKRYGKVEAWDAQGRPTPLKVVSVLENHAGVILEPVLPPSAPLPFLSFVKAQVKPADPLLIAQPAFLEDSLALRVDSAAVSALAANVKDDAVEMVWWQDRHGPDPVNAIPTVLCNGAGEPIGIVLDEASWRSDQGLDSWDGLSVLADRRIPRDALDATAARLRDEARKSLKEVELQFRNDSRIGQVLSAEEGKYVLYGLLLDAEGRIFVPTELDRDAIRQIDKIVVREEGRTVEAQFEGLFRDYGAFVVKAKGVSGEPAALPDKLTFPRGRIFHTLRVERRYGKRQEEADYNRYLDISKGYKDVRVIAPRKPVEVGDFIYDAEGRLAGFCAPIRREERDEILARQAKRQQPQGHQQRIHLFPEIAADLASPKARFDPVARPMTRQEEQGLCWFGVEFQPMTPALARAMQIEGPTRNGARGLLVTDVYAGSPAARTGVKRGDVLVTLVFPGAPGEIDLIQSARSSDGTGRSSGPPGFRPWRSRRNYLTGILTMLGDGRPAQFRLCSDGKESQLRFSIEKAPEDFDSAPQYEEPALGLTVRPVTYEVRNVLKLRPDSPGVVVSNVLEGNKAAVAQIRPYEIISHVDGKPVTTLKEFENALRSAATRHRVELLVFILGQTRIVEIDLNNG